jgi:hypothetical protein
MESNTLDRPTIERHLAAVRERLRSLGTLLDAGGGEAGIVARAALASSLGALEEVQSLVTDPREAGRVACPFCAARVMRAATLCFSCWRKIEQPLTR